MKHIASLLALTLALPLGVSASELGGKQAQSKKKKAKVKVEVVAPDTVPNTTFSYAYGMANTQGLKQFLIRQHNVDTAYMADFMRGFATTDQRPEDARLRAYLAGVDIRQQVERDILKRINRQLADNDTTTVLDGELFVKGFAQALEGRATEISMDSAMAVVQKMTNWYEERNLMAKHGDWKIQNEDWLKLNAKDSGVQTTESGLQYKVITKGDGPVPTADQRVKVHYEGKLIDGTVFDSSINRGQPATFGCSQVIKGWTEALTHMPVGSKWELYIPQALAYGTRETGKIPPFSTLIFTVELIEIVK